MTKSYFEMYNEFADACDIPQGSMNAPLNHQQVQLAKRLVEEEWEEETKEALRAHLVSPSIKSLVQVADGIGDSIYVLCQLARSLGIPLDSVFLCIHHSNMMKLGPKGKVERRADGKILKPVGWEPPNIKRVLELHADTTAFEQGQKHGNSTE